MGWCHKIRGIDLAKINIKLKKMKKLLFIFVTGCLLFASCEEEEINMPVASLEVSDTEVSVNQTVTFIFTGSDAKQTVVYTGDAGHEYALREQNNSGLVMSKGLLTYSYKTPGNYKVTLIATNYDREGKTILEAKCEAEIIVSDTRTDLSVISLKKDTYTKEIQGDFIDDVILFAVPYKIRLNNRDYAVNLAAQRIDITPVSESASIWINDEVYTATVKYDLTRQQTLKIRANSGDEQTFALRCLHFPIFEQFKINGVEGVVKYDDFSFNKTYITVTLPSATDISALTAEFASADAQEITVNGTPQISGVTTNSFVNPVIYTLKTTDAADDKLKCESVIEVNVVRD